jgi:hypothetical protein
LLSGGFGEAAAEIPQPSEGGETAEAAVPSSLANEPQEQFPATGGEELSLLEPASAVRPLVAEENAPAAAGSSGLFLIISELHNDQLTGIPFQAAVFRHGLGDTVLFSIFILASRGFQCYFLWFLG